MAVETAGELLRETKLHSVLATGKIVHIDYLDKTKSSTSKC